MGKIEKTFWWICFVLILYSTIGFKLIPDIIQEQAIKNLDENLTQKTTIEKVEFNPFTLNTKIHGFKLADEKQTTVSFEMLNADIAFLRSIFELHVSIEEVILKKLYVNIIEEKDGSINLSKLLKPSENKPEEKKNETSSDIKFLVSKILLQNTNINFTKENEVKPYKLALKDLNYSLYDLGTYKDALSSNDLNLKINDNTNINIVGAFKLAPFTMYGKAKISDLRIKELLDYKKELFNFDINEKANININLDYNVDLKDTTDVKLSSTLFDINNINLTQNDTNFTKLEKINIASFKFDLAKQNISLSDTDINKLLVTMVQDKNGINFANLINSSKEPAKEEEKKDKPKVEEDSKPWVIALNNIKLNNNDFTFDDKINSMLIQSKNFSSKASKLSINGSNINLDNISMSNPKISFGDNKNALFINTKNTNLKLNNLDLKGNLIAIKSLSLSDDNIDLKDNKSKLNIDINKTNLLVNSLNIDGSNIKIDSSKLKTALISFNDLNSKLNIKTTNTNLDANALSINGSKIKINSTKLKTAEIVLDDKNSKLNIKTADTNLNVNSLNIDGSKIDIAVINLDTSKIKLDDSANKMNIDVGNTSIDLKSFALNNSDILIKTIKLSKPDISLLDNTNNISLQTKDLEILINSLSQKKNTLSMDSIRILEPNVEFLNTKDKTKILASNLDLNVKGFSNSNSGLKVSSAALNKPSISVILPKNTNTAPVEKTPTKSKKSQQNEASAKLDIGPINIIDATMNFEDKNLPIPFKTTITKLNGKVSEFKNTTASSTKLEVNGIVDKYGTTKITGIVNPNSIKVLTDINMVFKNVDMENFTPYTGKFIGRKLDSGKLDLDLKYNIEKSNLDAKNNILIKNLKLGDKVASPDAVSLPLDLAIALIQDSSGVIDLNLPISGNVDDPQFSVAPIVWKAFVNLITKAITSPFSLLGAIFGFDENEIKSVNFDFGEDKITPIQKETLDKIAKILEKRPNLGLKLTASYDEQKDLEGLQKNAFEKIVESKIPDKNNKDYEITYLNFLEDLYGDYDKKVASLKQTHTKDEKLDTKSYINDLEKFIISKQNIEKKQLEEMAKNRIANIQKYLLEDKKINQKQVSLEKSIKIKTLSKKTSNIDLAIAKIK